MLLRESYIVRFWPQFEAFLAFQVATAHGLAPGSEISATYDRHHMLMVDQSISAEKAQKNEGGTQGQMAVCDPVNK